MEYYVLKFYESAKQKCPEVEQGFNRLEPKIKKIAMLCLGVLFGACAEMIITVLLFPKHLWYFIGILFCVGALFVLIAIDNKDQKVHMDKYMGSHKKKIGILGSVLNTEFEINTREKVEKLIDMYQECVDGKKAAEKRCHSIIVALFSAFAGVLTISFENMGVIGINFTSWIYLATILAVLVAVAAILIYSSTFFDSLRGKEEMMIKELKELILLHYYLGSA